MSSTKTVISKKIRDLRFLITNKILQIDNNITRSVICNNCVGAMVLHDYGLKFNSPFVNLYVTAPDYIKLVSDLKYYTANNAVLIDITGSSKYPKGLLQNEVTLHFLHYNSFEEAELKWRQRCKRIDYDNLYFIFVQQSSCTNTLLKMFDNMNFEHQISLVNKPIEGIKKQFVIPGYSSVRTLGHITDYCDIIGNRYYDNFDWKHFLKLKE